VKVGNSVINSNTFNDGTTIATVANMEDLIFRGNIDETEVGQLNIGIPMKITIGALQDISLEASLEYISPKATQNNGANQFEIKAAVRLNKLKESNTEQSAALVQSSAIRAGFSANAEIVLAEAIQVLSVPESAIEFSGDSTFVYVVQKGSDGKSYQRQNVTTGLSDGVNIEIKKGLKADEAVRGPQIITDDNE